MDFFGTSKTETETPTNQPSTNQIPKPINQGQKQNNKKPNNQKVNNQKVNNPKPNNQKVNNQKVNNKNKSLKNKIQTSVVETQKQVSEGVKETKSTLWSWFSGFMFPKKKETPVVQAGGKKKRKMKRASRK